jgi:hypothetical protein
MTVYNDPGTMNECTRRWQVPKMYKKEPHAGIRNYKTYHHPHLPTPDDRHRLNTP